MKKLLFLMTVLLLALGSIFPVAAQSDDVSSMAQYFPADTLVYGVTRSDDAFVEKLDGLFQHVLTYMPDEPQGFSLKDALYNSPLGMSSLELTFGEDIRPWLGDYMAFGLIGPLDQWNNGQRPIVGAIAITDRAAVESFISKLVDSTGDSASMFTQSTVGDFTVWEMPYTAIAIGDSVMYMADKVDVMPLEMDGTLAGVDSFQNTVAKMPLSGYDMFAYADVPVLGAQIMQNVEESNQPEIKPMMDFFQTVMDATGPAAVGISTLDDLTWTMDFVQLKGDTSKLEDLGITMDRPTKPVNLDFAANIPADAALVMLTDNVGPQTTAAFANMRALGDYLQKNHVFPQMDGRGGRFGGMGMNMMGNVNIGDAITFMEFGFAGLTGLNLQNDVLSWMDGGSAGYVRALPSDVLPMAVDVVALAETSDADATQNVLDHLATAFDQYDVTYSHEGTGPRSVLALTDLADKIFPPNVPFDVANADELDVLIGTNGSVFVMGTRPGATYSLNPDGADLASDATFTQASAYFLPHSSAVMYINLQPLFPVFQEFAQKMNASEREMSQIDQAVGVLSVVKSISLSESNDDSSRSGRLVISLAEGPM